MIYVHLISCAAAAGLLLPCAQSLSAAGQNKHTLTPSNICDYVSRVVLASALWRSKEKQCCNETDEHLGDHVADSITNES